MGLTRISTAGVVVVAFWALAAVGASMLPMTDPDTWWHIRVGREILETGAVPRVDTWSIAGAGRAWTSQDWASNVLMGSLFGRDDLGATRVSLVYGLMALASVAILWNAIAVRHPSVGWLSRCAWLLFGLVLAAPVLGARVQVVDLLLSTAVLNVLWRYLAAPRLWHLATLPVIALLWVNLHAGWPLLFLLGGAVVVGETVDRWLRPAVSELSLPAVKVVRLAGSLGVALLALAVNPNGIAIYGYPLDTLEISALASFVGEWQPARLTTTPGQLLAVFILVAVLPTLLVGRDRMRAADGFMLVGLTYMAVTAVRFLLVAGPIGAAIVCLVLSPAISASRLGRGTATVLQRLGRKPGDRRAVVNVVLVVALVAFSTALTIARIGPAGQRAAIVEVMPVGAVAWLREASVGDRIFNQYEWGGYVGLARPDRLVFIDGRADVYGNAVIRGYVEAISVNIDPDAYFAEHDVDHVLYPGDSTLGEWLDASPRWRVAYEDEVASVWVRD